MPEQVPPYGIAPPSRAGPAGRAGTGRVPGDSQGPAIGIGRVRRALACLAGPIPDLWAALEGAEAALSAAELPAAAQALLSASPFEVLPDQAGPEAAELAGQATAVGQASEAVIAPRSSPTLPSPHSGHNADLVSTAVRQGPTGASHPAPARPAQTAGRVESPPAAGAGPGAQPGLFVGPGPRTPGPVFPLQAGGRQAQPGHEARRGPRTARPAGGSAGTQAPGETRLAELPAAPAGSAGGGLAPPLPLALAPSTTPLLMSHPPPAGEPALRADRGQPSAALAPEADQRLPVGGALPAGQEPPLSPEAVPLAAALGEVGRLADEILAETRAGGVHTPVTRAESDAQPRTVLTAREGKARRAVGAPGHMAGESSLGRLAALASRQREPVAGPAPPEPAAKPGEPRDEAAWRPTAALALQEVLDRSRPGDEVAALDDVRLAVIPPLAQGAKPAPQPGSEQAGLPPWSAPAAPLDAAGLAELVNEVLAEQARLHGVDLS